MRTGKTQDLKHRKNVLIIVLETGEIFKDENIYIFSPYFEIYWRKKR